MLERINKIAERKDFKPFTDLGAKQICQPIRKNVKAIASILATAEGTPLSQRIQYGKMAGMKFEEGQNELPIEYSEFEALEKIALLLFELDEEDVKDFDNMDEGEVNAGLQLFFMKRKGI